MKTWHGANGTHGAYVPHVALGAHGAGDAFCAHGAHGVHINALQFTSSELQGEALTGTP